MKLQHGPLLYEGKAKKVFATNKPEQVLVHFKNDATAFNALKRSKIEGKGGLNCQISAAIFSRLQTQRVPNHFLEIEDETWMRVQRVEIIPLEVVVRNIASGSLCKETPLENGFRLPFPLLEFYFKDDSLGDPLLTDSRLKLLGLITSDQKAEIEKLAFIVNDILKDFFLDLDLTLVDFKLEFGVNNFGELLVADEISPDTCRLWDNRCDDENQRILDKDRFRKDLGGLAEAYGEILSRIKKLS